MDIKNILVPTDFSSCAEAALSFAAEIALSLKADIYLMHSAQSTFSVAPEKLVEQIEDRNRLKEINIRTIEEIGDPSSAIMRQTDEKKADLVVMGNKGRSGPRKLLGSTTTEVISKSKVPVLAIPKESQFSGLANIVFATDYHDGDLSALEELVIWARFFNSKLHVLHVTPENNLLAKIKLRGFKELTCEQIHYDKLSFNNVVSPSLLTGFNQYMKDHNVKLLTLIRHPKTAFKKLGQKSHTREMGLYSETPLLVLIGKEPKT